MDTTPTSQPRRKTSFVRRKTDVGFVAPAENAAASAGARIKEWAEERKRAGAGNVCAVCGASGLDEDEDRDESERVKLTVNIPEREMAALRKIATDRDLSLTDVVRRAIAMEQFIEDVNREGGKLLVEQPDRTMRELVLR